VLEARHRRMQFDVLALGLDPLTVAGQGQHWGFG